MEALMCNPGDDLVIRGRRLGNGSAQQFLHNPHGGTFHPSPASRIVHKVLACTPKLVPARSVPQCSLT